MHLQCVRKLNLFPSDSRGPRGCPELAEVGTVVLLRSELRLIAHRLLAEVCGPLWGGP